MEAAAAGVFAGEAMWLDRWVARRRTYSLAVTLFLYGFISSLAITLEP